MQRDVEVNFYRILGAILNQLLWTQRAIVLQAQGINDSLLAPETWRRGEETWQEKCTVFRLGGDKLFVVRRRIELYQSTGQTVFRFIVPNGKFIQPIKGNIYL